MVWHRITKIGPYLIAGLILLGSAGIAHAGDWWSVLQSIEAETGGRVGVAMFENKSGKRWHYNEGQRFPLNSTFKSFACGALLAKVDAGALDLSATRSFTKADLVRWSPIVEKHIGKPLTYHQLCEAAVTMSDNSAANAVLDAIDGPAGFTRFMRSIGDQQSRLDRMEPDLNEGRPGDARDTTTPLAAITSLETLLFGDVLTLSSRQQLTQWMIDDKVAGKLTRSVLPKGWRIGDKSGAGGHGSRGIIAVVWPEEDKPVFMAIYLTETKLSFPARNAAIAKISKALIAELQSD